MEITREEAAQLLEEYVTDEYQRLHSRMVAHVMEKFALSRGEDGKLWYLAGLLHDLDFTKYPDEHPQKELEWFKSWGYPEDFIHAVAAHGHSLNGVEPQTLMAKALLSVDELCGFLHAYSLMRPEGFSGMSPSKAAKKFKDKSFAAKIDREEVNYGVEKLGVPIEEHFGFVIKALQSFDSA
ncbi:MAG: HD domain-containing protein [Patescibacteria group bacterium]